MALTTSGCSVLLSGAGCEKYVLAAEVTDTGAKKYFIGLYTITFTATDTFGNVGTCDYNVEVKDCAPVRHCLCLVLPLP